MHSRRYRLFAIGVGACLATLVAEARAGQPADETEGLIRTELTLSTHQISVAYAPALEADDPAHAALLSATAGSTDAPVRVARLEGHRALRIGSLGPEPGETPSSGPHHDLWLTRTDDGWALDARPVDRESSEPGVAGRISLSHQTATSASETFTAGLVPTGADTGRLVLRWGTHAWATDFEFLQLPPRPVPRRTSGVGRASSLTRDSDTSARARSAALGRRNETALVTPDGAHIQVLFFKEIGVDGEDFAGIASTGEGELIQFTRAAVIRLRTEVPLRFGQTMVPTGNLAPDFPGAYGLWLKKAGLGWRLVFNHEADSWGTQHDPAFDAAEIELTYSRSDALDRLLGVSLLPTGTDRGQLLIHWGPHEWAADYVVAP